MFIFDIVSEIVNSSELTRALNVGKLKVQEYVERIFIKLFIQKCFYSSV